MKRFMVQIIGGKFTIVDRNTNTVLTRKATGKVLDYPSEVEAEEACAAFNECDEGRAD